MLAVKPTRDLLRRPLVAADQTLHFLPQPRPFLGPARLGPPGRLIGPGLSGEGPIALAATVGLDLAADCAPVPAEPPPDSRVGLTSNDADPDLFPVGQRQRAGPRGANAQH